jgi:hypothetical protein
MRTVLGNGNPNRVLDVHLIMDAPALAGLAAASVHGLLALGRMPVPVSLGTAMRRRSRCRATLP